MHVELGQVPFSATFTALEDFGADLLCPAFVDQVVHITKSFISHYVWRFLNSFKSPVFCLII